MTTKRQLSRLLAKDVARQFEQFTRLWDGYSEEINTESPHRQRTAVNKLFGYAMFLGMPTGKKGAKARPLRTLKEWQKRVGGLRDIDVTREWLEKCRKAAGTAGDAAAKVLDGELLERRRSILEQVRLDVRGLPGADARVAVHAAKKSFDDTLLALEGRQNFDHRPALRVVAEPWQEALADLHNDQSDEALHEFRVRNKKLRFVLEILAEEEGKRSMLGKHLAERAKIANDTHTALGNLSDLKVLRDVLRLARGRWALEGKKLDTSAAELEAARTAIEAKEFARWYELWPRINHEAFLGELLETEPGK